MVFNLLNKCQVKWKILSNFSGHLRKLELWSIMENHILSKTHCLNFQNQVLPALCCPFPQLRPLVSLWLQIVNWGCPLDSYHKEANPHQFYGQLSLAKVWELYHFPPRFLWSQSDQPIGKVSFHLEKVIKMSDRS